MKRVVSCQLLANNKAATLFLVAAILFVTFSPAYSQKSNPSESITSEFSFIDRIHAGDLIDIHVSGHLDYDWRGTLTPEGFLEGYDRISKPIFARCKTETEIGLEIDSVLSEILRNPKTEVRIVDRSKRATVVIDGAIRTPQRFQVKRPVHLNEVVVKAGGLTDRSSGRVMISRPAGTSCIDSSKETSTRFDISISDLLAGKAEANPVIVSGDLIVVIEASPVFLLGAVQGQGRIDFRPELTVSRAIDSAGGLAKNAVPQRINIFRRDGGSVVIPVNLEKVRANESDDIVLRPNDIIDVPFKGRPARRLPPVFETEAESSERRAKLPVTVIE